MSRSREGTWLTTRSPIRTTPAEISSSPATIRSAVVLPHPDGPTRTMNSPSATSSASESTAFVPSPYTFETSSKTTSATRPLELSDAGDPIPAGIDVRGRRGGRHAGRGPRALPFVLRGRFRRRRPRSGGEDRRADGALLRVDRAEVLDDLEAAASGLGDVHVQASVVLARHHGRRSAGAFGDLRVIEGCDHVRLPERASLGHRGGPEA